MDFGQWTSQFEMRLRHRWPESGAYDEMKALLCDVHELMLPRYAPSALENAYAMLSEPTLGGESRKWQSLLTRAGPPSRLLPVDVEEAALWVGGLVRACDVLCHQALGYLTPPPGQWKSGDWWVVPVPRQVPWRQPKQGDGFHRRGLRHHRLIPTTVRGMTVEMWRFPKSDKPLGQPLTKLGAAVFNDVALETASDGTGRFHVQGIKVHDVAAAIEEHFRHAASGRCFAVVWPELTVPGEVRGFIEHLVVSTQGRGAEIYVAGSWHESETAGRYNVSHVYDRFGVDTVQHRKFVPFLDTHHGRESIERGDSLHVIVTDHYIVSVAICKDFCGITSGSSPFADLNVDLLLVPSMSTRSAMGSHQTVAKTIRHSVGTRTFVVQQMDETVGDVHALVLVPKPDPLTTALEMKERKIWISAEVT
ncbi:putative amidohydrolase [Rhizobium sp. PP-F2F-G38]|nr:putative amidohydrolase [Rhizobium sp. PP-F2F-G38]